MVVGTEYRVHGTPVIQHSHKCCVRMWSSRRSSASNAGGLPPSSATCCVLPALTSTQIVKPLWEPFVALFPKLKPLLESLNENCEFYRQEGRRLERARLSATSNSPCPQGGRRKGGGNDGEVLVGSDGAHDNEGNNEGNGRGLGGGGDDQASPSVEEDWAEAGKKAAGDDGGDHRPVSFKDGGG